MRIISICLALLSTPVAAHEYWIEPLDWQINTQVELFERAPDGEVTLTLHRTDAEGVARLPVSPGHDYLTNAVVLREPDNATAVATGAVWESLWATLTFAIPD